MRGKWTRRQAVSGMWCVVVCALILVAGCGGGGGGGGGGAPANTIPTAVFTATPTAGSVPLTVVFDAAASSDSDGTISSYRWTFGDGGTGTGVSVQHTYQTAGTYTAQLTVTDDDGAVDTETVQVVVSSTPNITPVARFTATPTAGSVPLTIVFDAAASSDSDGTISSYRWTFGDGGTGTGVSVQHTYQTAGTYTAQLTVTDDDGAVDMEIAQIVAAAAVTATISGTVSATAHTVSDSDVNDTNATNIANDDFDSAQSILAPVSVSGYVNMAGAGDPGASFDSGDTDDFFQVILTQGMTLTLYMAENPALYELDLYLYNAQRVLEGSAVTDAEDGIARLTAPASGTYFVRVGAVGTFFFQTASVYTLTIGLQEPLSARRSLCLGDAFVPGEVVVGLVSEAGGTVSALSGKATRLGDFGLRSQSGAFSGVQLVRRAEGTDRETLLKRLGVSSAFERSVGPGILDAGTREKMETLWMVRGLRKITGIQYAEPNYIRTPLQVPDDAYYSYQWHYPLINLPDAWDVTTGSSDVIVAVVDTGVLLAHPDLYGQFVPGYDFISDEEMALDGDGIDANPDDPGDEDGVDGGSSFHGTHVAGTIAAATNNGKGVAGVAWNARIMPLRVLGKGGGTSYDIRQAVRYAAGLSNDAPTIPAAPADIINLSLGGGSYSQAEQDAYTQARNAGVIVIAAAGNSGTSAPMYPAAYDNVVSVSAVGIDETLAAYSNFGGTIDVAAPGGSDTDRNADGYVDGVLSTIGDDSAGTIAMEYAFSMGTSMAAPHVAGVAALMKALYPELTPEEFDVLLSGGYLTRDLGASGWDDSFGWGLIDAHKAVRIAQQGGVNGAIPATLVVRPGILNFGTMTTDLAVTVENGGAGALAVTGVQADAHWLSLVASDVDPDGLGTYTATVARGSLSDGTYTGTVIFTSSVNTVTVNVVVQKGSAAASTYAGYHYVLLLDPDTLDPVAQDAGAVSGDGFAYAFPGLPVGATYVIFAGTDPNNDSFICDAGEACGAYISMDQPVVVTVTGDRSGLDFTTDISFSLPASAARVLGGIGLPLQRNILRRVAE